MLERIFTENAPKAIGPYSQATIAGNMVYTSGQIPINPLTGNVVEGGAAEQSEQAMKNLKAVLEAAGSSMEKVIKTTIFIKNMEQFSIINEVYGKYFTGSYPSRTTVEVARLPKDVLIEIEAIAVI
jgi:2-iminobutanoate/2-iminopropanoate deaminase